MSSGIMLKRDDLRHLSLREEPIGDSALIEDLDGACVQATRARADELLARAPLDNGDVDARQRQLARQHQPGRTAPGDHHPVRPWHLQVKLSSTSPIRTSLLLTLSMASFTRASGMTSTIASMPCCAENSSICMVSARLPM